MNEKPPFGILPRKLHDQRRIINLTEAIERYARAGRLDGSVEAWAEEIIDLCRYEQGREGRSMGYEQKLITRDRVRQPDTNMLEEEITSSIESFEKANPEYKIVHVFVNRKEDGLDVTVTQRMS